MFRSGCEELLSDGLLSVDFDHRSVAISLVPQTASCGGSTRRSDQNCCLVLIRWLAAETITEQTILDQVKDFRLADGFVYVRHTCEIQSRFELRNSKSFKNKTNF